VHQREEGGGEIERKMRREEERVEVGRKESTRLNYVLVEVVDSFNYS